MTTICDAVEVWENWYKPMTNKFISDDETKLFETYGEEFDFVFNSPEKKVWTWVDGSDGTYIVSGLHMVNRIGYFVTEEEWQSHMVVPYEKYEVQS